VLKPADQMHDSEESKKIMLVDIHPHMGGINQAAIDTWERLQRFFPIKKD